MRILVFLISVVLLAACGGPEYSHVGADESSDQGGVPSPGDTGPWNGSSYSYNSVALSDGDGRVGSAQTLFYDVDAPVEPDQVFWRVLEAPEGSVYQPPTAEPALGDVFDKIHDADIQDNYVYMTAWQDGLAIGELVDGKIEIVSRTQLTYPGIPSLIVEASSVKVSGDLAIVGMSRMGVLLVDVSDRAAPVVLDHWAGDVTDYNALEFHNNYVYTTDRLRGLIVLEVVGNELVERGEMWLGEMFSGSAISEDVLAIGVQEDGVVLYDITDPLNMEFIGQPLSIWDYGTGISIVDNLMLVGYVYGSVKIYDLDAPDYIREVASARVPGFIYEAFFDGTNIYIPDPADGTLNHMVFDGTTIERVDHTSRVGRPRAIDADGTDVYIFGSPDETGANAYRIADLPTGAKGETFTFTPDLPGDYVIETHGTNDAWHFPGVTTITISE